MPVATVEEAVKLLFSGQSSTGISAGTASALAALLGTRINPNLAQQGIPDPRVVYRKISDVPLHSFTGNSGLSASRFQIDIYANTYASSKAVRDAMKANCDGYSGTIGTVTIGCCIKQNEHDIDDPEPDVELNREFGCSVDYLIWHSE